MRGLLGSLRFTARLLLKSPGFTITCVLILGFGIGLNTAIFSLINAVILKPLPYPNPERLVHVCQPYQNDPFMGIDYPDYVDMAAAQHTFESLAVAFRGSLALISGGEPEHVEVDFVSPSMFKVSGLPTVLGRVFTEQEDIPNGPLLAVLGEHYWRTRFQSDPNIIGKNLTLSDHSFQVIGVAPAQVSDWGPPGIDVYIPANAVAPLGFFPTNRGYPLELRDLHYFFCVGRLKDGDSVAQAQADLETVHKNLSSRYPDTNRDYGLRIIPLLESMVNDYAATTWLLAAAVGCLLLISCANVANLLFAHGLQRRREIMIRATLGATRWRLISQLLIETMFLSLLGGVLGLLIALGSAETIKKASPPNLYRFHELSVDLSALMFVSGVILVTSLLSGVLPAFNLSRTSLVPALKDEGGRAGTSGRQRHRTQSALVTAQVALACVLLIGTGLLVRSFEAAQNVPLGFNPHHLLTARINLGSAKYETDGARTRAFWNELMSKIRRLPGVTEAALNDSPPLKWDSEILDLFTVDGQPNPAPGREPALVWQMVSSDYFRTMQVPVLRGRDFNSHDTKDKQSVVIVDEALAERYFPGQNPLGNSISVQDPEGTRDCTIVGIVPHVRYKSPGQAESAFQAYFPVSQWDYAAAVVVLRSQLDPAALIPTVREVVTSIDPGVPIHDVNTYDDLIASKFVTRKLCMLLVAFFSGAALFLSAIGVYGILAYSVGQRGREIGIRIALGAKSNNIVGLIIEQGLKIVGAGLLVGLLASLILARFIEGILYGVSATDPLSLCAAIIVLGLAALLACLLPALRATRIDPITALRE
jgi:putative ABC transport system permease protein